MSRTRFAVTVLALGVGLFLLTLGSIEILGHVWGQP